MTFNAARPPTHTGKLRGVHLAIVVENKDGDGNPGYRVKVKYPWLSEEEKAYWARIVVPMAGPDRGAYCLPELDDQVLVVFEHGDINRPLVLGALWSKKQEPVEVNASGKNNTKLIKSRSGHRIIFDDTEGAEKITIVDKTRKNKVVLDSVGKIVKIESDGDITIKSAANAIVHGNALKLGTSAKLTARGQQVLVHASSSFELKASRSVVVNGSSVTLNVSNSQAAQVSGTGSGFLGGAAEERPKDQIAEQQSRAGAGAGTDGGGGRSDAGAREASEQEVTRAPEGDAYVLSAEMKAPGGEPLAHERVSIIDPDTGGVLTEVLTDQDGRFATRVPAQKNYHLRLEGEELYHTEQLQDDEIAYLLAVKFFTFARKPLANKRVKITGEGLTVEEATDDEGAIRMHMPAGEYELDLEGVKFRAHTILQMELEAGDPHQFIGGNAYVLSAELKSSGGEPLGFEQVSIIDPQTGAQVGEPVITDADGRLRAMVPDDLKYDLKIHDDGDPVEHRQPSDRELQPLLCVRFLTRDGRPIAHEPVAVRGPGESGQHETDTEGTLLLPTFAGEYEIAIRRRTFRAHTLLASELAADAEIYQFAIEDGA